MYIVEKQMLELIESLKNQIVYITNCLTQNLHLWERREYEKGLYEAQLSLAQKESHYEYCKKNNLY